jgi:hypothetical protein
MKSYALKRDFISVVKKARIKMSQKAFNNPLTHQLLLLPRSENARDLSQRSDHLLFQNSIRDNKRKSNAWINQNA